MLCMTTAHQLDLWRSSSTEHQRIEFKEAKQQFDCEKLYKYCVAIANEGGGYFILGVADKPPRLVVGSNAFRDITDITEKLFQVLGFRVDVEELLHSDGRVVIFHIPSRPRGTAYHREGAYLMRSGESLVPMSEDQLRKIFAEGQPDWLEEHALIDLEPQDIIGLLDTSTYFELLKIPYPSNRDGVLDRLKQDRLIDFSDSGIGIRRLAGLLLARKLEYFPDLVRKSPRVIVYSGNSKLETKMDQIGTLGFAVGFQRLVQFVMTQLPQNEIVEDALRKDVKLVPEIVIRELVANALIHQELSMMGSSVVIEIYQDRVEISNPGEPLVPVERFIDGYQSRNERMADLMRRFGICEEKSSGIDKVIHTAEIFQLPAPDFRLGFKRTTATIYGPRPFEGMLRDDRIRACYQHCCLKWVTSKRMTNQSLRQRFSLEESKSASVSQIIAATLETGLIRPDDKVGGSKKFARYLPFWA